MKEKRLTQTQQVINTLREQGGYATLGNLYHLVDTSTWATKTPNESIRRIVNGGPLFTCFFRLSFSYLSSNSSSSKPSFRSLSYARRCFLRNSVFDWQ